MAKPTREMSPGGGIPDAVPVDLTGLVEYAEGAVVSRILAKNKAGTMTVFAFDAGQELSEHSTPFDAFVQVLEGSVELIIDGQPMKATSGQIVLMPADIPHALHALTPFKMLLTMIRN